MRYQLFFTALVFSIFISASNATEIKAQRQLSKTLIQTFKTEVSDYFKHSPQELKLPKKIKIKKTSIPNNAFYQAPKKILLSAEFLNYSDSEVLPIMYHEFGHALFQLNILEPLSKIFPQLDLAELKQKLAAVNEIYSDLFQHSVTESAPSFKILEESLLRLYQSAGDSYYLEYLNSGIYQCRNLSQLTDNIAKTNYSEIEMNVHHQLCAFGSYIWRNQLVDHKVETFAWFNQRLKTALIKLIKLADWDLATQQPFTLNQYLINEFAK